MQDSYSKHYMTISVGDYVEPRIEWPAVGAQGVVVDDGVLAGLAAIERMWAAAGWDPSRIATGGIFLDTSLLGGWSVEVESSETPASFPGTSAPGPVVL